MEESLLSNENMIEGYAQHKKQQSHKSTRKLTRVNESRNRQEQTVQTRYDKHTIKLK